MLQILLPNYSLRSPILCRISIRRCILLTEVAMTPPTHHDLVAGIRARDPHVIGWLYKTYAPRLYASLLRRVGDTDLAFDLHHEVFARLLERAPTFEDRGVPVGAWLFRVARDLVVDILRQRQRTVLLPLATMADTTPDLDSLFVTESERQTLHEALSRLPEQYRPVLILRYQYQLTLPDIAHQLGRSQEATKAVLFRAVLALRKQMQLLNADPIAPTPPMA